MHCDDQAVVNRLVVLADANDGRVKAVALDETAEFDWEVANNTVTFVFGDASARDRFGRECGRLLAADAVREVARSDSAR